MAAVAYTSTKAEIDYYQSQLEKRRTGSRTGRRTNGTSVRSLLRKGFEALLDPIVKKITSTPRCGDLMMNEE